MKRPTGDQEMRLEKWVVTRLYIKGPVYRAKKLWLSLRHKVVAEVSGELRAPDSSGSKWRGRLCRGKPGRKLQRVLQGD